MTIIKRHKKNFFFMLFFRKYVILEVSGFVVIMGLKNNRQDCR